MPQRANPYLFALNSDFHDSFTLDPDLSAFGQTRLAEHQILRCDDLYAKNTFDRPDRVAPETLTVFRPHPAAAVVEPHHLRVGRVAVDDVNSDFASSATVFGLSVRHDFSVGDWRLQPFLARIDNLTESSSGKSFDTVSSHSFAFSQFACCS